MHYYSRAALICCAALGTLLAGPENGTAQEFADHRYTSEAIEAGSRVYVADCALCHGSGGADVDGVDIRRGVFRNVSSDEDLRRIITNGVAVRVGDAARGRVLFEGAGDCASCHRVNGQGPRTAPDLSEIGAIRNPAALQRTLLDPSSALMPIDRPVRAVTRSGETIRGRRLNEDTYTVQLIDSEERLRSLVKADLVEYEVSETPIMEPTTLSADQVADVIGYLLSLRGLP